ncbi:hypothetical protein NUW58_g1737 [Xylaria curta]|uniref:Uncharacterized protein n=1 Tax=Xylaria curta TaxID=42375 RepID=A0ACC1PKW7_9PEZI|nr:hypothetical protein NUW58_g1737 [Xylaria curta]
MDCVHITAMPEPAADDAREFAVVVVLYATVGVRELVLPPAGPAPESEKTDQLSTSFSIHRLRLLVSTSATRTPVFRVNAAAQRAFSISAARPKTDVVQETEVPVSVYSPDSKGAAGSTSDHFSIPVNRDDAKPKPFPPRGGRRCHSLTKKVYGDMPPMMQKMSIMDKVVVVTGVN